MVDDDPLNQEVAQVQLEAVGLVVDAAADGAEAVAMARETCYALILMDMQMPKLGGLDATRQIRQLAGYAQTPILAMTANVFVEDKAHCLEAGMNDFLMKPYAPEVLFALVLQWLNQKPAAGSALPRNPVAS